MSESKSKSKRSLSNPRSQPDSHVGLLACSGFISPNEYSDKTRGLCASLLRKDVGDINYSDIFNGIFERIRLEQAFDVVEILESKRKELNVNGASIEKCLMLNRWITDISDNVHGFKQLIREIYAEMITQITDNQPNQMMNSPEDFRQRERNFHKRVDAQNIRRLFYYSPTESKAPSIIHLQNQTTTLLSYLIDSKMRYDRNSRDNDLKELEKIFGTSFMVIAQPHSGANPVLVAERKGVGTHVAKVSVILISLLHDFMQTHPNIIQLGDIEVQLCPTDNPYRLDQPENLSWKTCELKINPNDRPQIVQYAEIKSITIKQTSSSDGQIHFAEKLHFFNFLIKFSLNINEHKISTNYRIPLKSLPFGIVTYNGHIPHSLTKVILDDIRRFSQHQSINVKIVSNFVRRYFMHRTGVEPKADLQTYIKQELTRAKDERTNGQSLEEIYADFLEEFANQVEFMAKHPVLIMFYADGLFLGPCDSQKSAEVMKRSAVLNSSIVGLRFNSIKVDYKPNTTTTIAANASRGMKASTCSIRVDIWDPRINYFQNRTFDSANLTVDILKFVSTALETEAKNIKILSTFDAFDNVRSYECFTKYYDERLLDFHKADPKYTPIIDLLHHVNNTTDNNNNNHLNVLPARSVMQNRSSPNPLYNDEDVFQYVVAKPELCLKIFRHFQQQMRLEAQQQMSSPQTVSLTMPNQATIENSCPYVSIFPENSIQTLPQQQTQSVSMSTSESTSDGSHQGVDDFFYQDSP